MAPLGRESSGLIRPRIQWPHSAANHLAPLGREWNGSIRARVNTEIEDAWAAEIERRIADVESGAVQVIPIAEALAQVRAALK